MKQLNSHNFEEVYKWLGINLDTLGCVMVNLSPIPSIIEAGSEETAVPYYAKDKTRFWINGWVADKAPHITLLYGLLDEGKNLELHISKVLEGWKLDTVEIEDIGYFESPYPDEPYYCIVAHLKLTPELLEGHQRLEFLPHINTFAGYKAHFTLAYIEKNAAARDGLIATLKEKYVGKKLSVGELNLGDKK